MSFEAQLKSTYAAVHKRLLNPPPPIPKPKPKIVLVPPRVEVSPTIHTPKPVKAEEPPQPQYSLKALCTWVAALEGVSVKILIGPQQHKGASQARKIFYFLAMRRSGGRFNSPMVGRFLNRDHSTVLDGAKSIAHLRQTDRALDFRLTQYEETLDQIAEDDVVICPCCHSRIKT